MKPLPFESVFNVAFFEKDSFENFLKFDPTVEVKKNYFDGRIVYEPSAKLKEYVKFIREYVISYLSINLDVVFSYRKGSSTYNAVEMHSSSKVFYNTDIKNFFPSIDREFAKQIIKKNIDNIPITDISDYVDFLLNFIIFDNNLPVGFSSSPSFSNACLFEFDNALEMYCKDNDLIYSRYSDDIIISSAKDEGFDSIPNYVSQLLWDNYGARFKINDEKSKLIRKGNKIKLLGMVVLPSGKISVDISIKKRVEHLIHFYITNKEKFVDAVSSDSKIKTEGLTIEQKREKGVEVISGLLNHINTIDKSYLNKLRKKYGNVIVDMFFHKDVN